MDVSRPCLSLMPRALQGEGEYKDTCTMRINTLTSSWQMVGLQAALSWSLGTLPHLAFCQLPDRSVTNDTSP